MNYRFLTILTLIGILSFSSQSLFAETQALEKLRQFYIFSALNNSSKTVRKPLHDDQIRVHISCEAADETFCNKKNISELYLVNLAENSHFTWKLVDKDTDVDLRFSKASHLGIERDSLLRTYNHGYLDFEDLECQLGYSVENSRIFNATIVVSSEAPTHKIRSCIVAQFLQSLGVALPWENGFSGAWNDSKNGFSKLNEKDFLQTRATYFVEIFLHTCVSVKPGMNAQDLAVAIADDGQCIESLKREILNSKK